MRICIPTETGDGLGARVHEHFGSAPVFTIFETDTAALEVVENPNNQHFHGTCQPLNALNGTDVDVVVCSGMGARAVQKLNQGGIKAYRAKGASVGEVIENYGCGDLEEIMPGNACAQHHCH